jgi:hypothetical protein
VIAFVDGLQQRRQMGLGPRLLGGRDQDQREMGAGQAALDGAADAVPLDRHDTDLHRPTHRHQVVGQRRDDRPGAVGGQVGEQDDADAGVGQRFALVGVVEFLAGGHSCSRSR